MPIRATTPRAQRIAAMFDFSVGRGLEIGPLDRPFLARADVDVRYADLFPREQLMANHQGTPGHTVEDIPEIDYPLWDGTRMRTVAEAAAAGAPFDWAYASHVIEHVPDVIGWLQELASLVAEDGALVLVVPDRRYCFDAHRPPTTVGEMLLAHQHGDTIPSVRAVYDHFRTAVRASAHELWKGQIPSIDARVHDLALVKDQLARAEKGEYLDCHVWTFTDSSFVGQIDELRALGVIDWWVESIQPVPREELEFCAVLRRGTPPAGHDAAVEAPIPDWLAELKDLREQNRELRKRLREQRGTLREQRRTIKEQRKRIRSLRSQLQAIRGSRRWRLTSALVAPVARLRRVDRTRG